MARTPALAMPGFRRGRETARYEKGREQTIMLGLEADRRLAWAWLRGFLWGAGTGALLVALVAAAGAGAAWIILT